MDNECKYCCDYDNRHTVYSDEKDFVSASGGFQVAKEINRLSVNIGGIFANFKINYCPMCNRKLE